MKTWKKVLLCCFVVILVVCAVGIFCFVHNESKIKEYSSYCSDYLRTELSEYVGDVSLVYDGVSDGKYFYTGKASYHGDYYGYACVVSGKDQVKFKFIPIEQYNSELFVSYYDNFDFNVMGTYVDGVKQGVWLTYDEGGNLINMQKYVDGQLVGDEATTYKLVGPGEGFDSEIDAGKLVLRGVYDDHSDVIFIEQGMWENFINPDEIVYGGDVIFKGEMTGIDGAAGTHYYMADSIDELEVLYSNVVSDSGE